MGSKEGQKGGRPECGSCGLGLSPSSSLTQLSPDRQEKMGSHIPVLRGFLQTQPPNSNWIFREFRKLRWEWEPQRVYRCAEKPSVVCKLPHKVITPSLAPCDPAGDEPTAWPRATGPFHCADHSCERMEVPSQRCPHASSTPPTHTPWELQPLISIVDNQCPHFLPLRSQGT